MAPVAEVGKTGDMLALRVRGHGTWREAHALNAWVEGAIEAGTKGAAIDLGDVPYLDSTFVGTIVGVQRVLMRRGAGEAVLYGVADKLRAIFHELRVGVVIHDIRSEAFPYDVEWSPISTEEPGREQLTRLVLAAHESLMDIEESNVPRFAKAVDMLRAELNEETAEETAEEQSQGNTRGEEEDTETSG